VAKNFNLRNKGRRMEVIGVLINCTLSLILFALLKIGSELEKIRENQTPLTRRRRYGEERSDI
jgi:hypothetical protein